MIEAPSEPRIEVLVGGACKLHLDDGRVVRGELQPTPDDGASLVVQGESGTLTLPRAAARLLRLRLPRGTRPAAEKLQATPPGRALAVALPTLQALTVQCNATHSAPHGGLWLDVQLPDGSAEAPPRNVAELRAALDRPPQRHARHATTAAASAAHRRDAAAGRRSGVAIRRQVAPDAPHSTFACNKDSA